jgi:septum site-determining protein MinC
LRLAGVLVISLGTFSDKPLYADMSQIELQDKDPVFQLKGSMLAITVLELGRNNLEALDRQLAAKVAQAPNFFSNTPLVLALARPAHPGHSCQPDRRHRRRHRHRPARFATIGCA